MRDKWRKIVRTFFFYQKSDRNAIVILGVLVLLAITTNIIIRNRPPKSTSDFNQIESLFAIWERKKALEQERLVLFPFNPNTISDEAIDSLLLPPFIKKNILNYRNAGGKYKSLADVRKIYGMNDSIFAVLEEYIQIEKTVYHSSEITKKKIVRPIERNNFNPNTATFQELEKLGFSSFQAKNVIKYRDSGGHFGKPEDLQKIYGIDIAFYNKISPYIKLPPADFKTVTPSQENTNTYVELNTADSATLVQLRGIGTSYAKRILKYRNLLGGFHSKNQIKEIYHFPEETYEMIKENIYADTLKIIKLRINFAEYTELIRHPYLDKNTVKAILKAREKNGAFKNSAEIKAAGGFDEKTYQKIKPYLTCR